VTVHSLHPSLERSRGFATAPWWEPVYREAFPSFEGMTYVNRDGSGQRDGIDRLIALTSGRTIAIDEKVRERDYPDFCLEYWSVKHKGAGQRDKPGWVAKELRCDYIAYAFVPSGRCYLLPFHDLRRAWRRHHREWVDAYREIRADNHFYETVSVGVPIGVVLRAMSDASLIRFDSKVAA
jgi:hypothetical protein